MDQGVKPTVPEILPLVNAYYALPGHGMGGALHIVLEDSNVQDNHVRWCIEYARENFDDPAAVLGEILLRMSRTQRAKLASLHDYPTEDASLWPAAIAHIRLPTGAS